MDKSSVDIAGEGGNGIKCLGQKIILFNNYFDSEELVYILKGSNNIMSMKMARSLNIVPKQFPSIANDDNPPPPPDPPTPQSIRCWMVEASTLAVEH